MKTPYLKMQLRHNGTIKNKLKLKNKYKIFKVANCNF